MADTGWVGMLPKMVLGAAGILFTMLVGYFIWLGTTLVGVKQDVAIIKTDVASLNSTRREQEGQKAESNRQRLDALEGEEEHDTK